MEDISEESEVSIPYRYGITLLGDLEWNGYAEFQFLIGTVLQIL